MAERRSRRRNTTLLLKQVLVIPRLIIPRGWSAAIVGQDFSFAFHGTRAGNQHLDPYEAREKFLAIETPKQALSFFNRFGPFEVQSGMLGVDLPSGAAGVAPTLSFEALRTHQDLYQKALLNPKRWMTGNRNFDMTQETGVEGFRELVRLNFRRRPKLTIEPGPPPSLLMESAHVSQAIYATIYLDWLRGLKSVKCSQCGKIARQGNRHFMRFCSVRCGNIYRKNDWNEKRQNSAAKDKGLQERGGKA